MPTQEGKLHPSKSNKVNFFQETQKKDTHTNINITSKITERNNHYFLKSLNNNGLNSPIKRPRLTEIFFM